MSHSLTMPANISTMWNMLQGINVDLSNNSHLRQNKYLEMDSLNHPRCIFSHHRSPLQRRKIPLAKDTGTAGERYPNIANPFIAANAMIHMNVSIASVFMMFLIVLIILNSQATTSCQEIEENESQSRQPLCSKCSIQNAYECFTPT